MHGFLSQMPGVCGLYIFVCVFVRLKRLNGLHLVQWLAVPGFCQVLDVHCLCVCITKKEREGERWIDVERDREERGAEERKIRETEERLSHIHNS